MIDSKININQTCKSTTGQNGFNCYLSNQAYQAATEKKVELQQECGACFTFDPKDPIFTIKTVPCVGSGPPPPPPPPPPGPGFSIMTIIIIIIAAILFLIVFGIIIGLIVHRNRTRNSEDYYRQYYPYYQR